MSSDYTLFQKCAAEAIGTGMIVAGGCGAVCAVKYANMPMGPLGIPVIFGVTVATAIYTTRDVSGAHLNPAMTASFVVNRPDALPKSHILPYMASQMFGATLAGAANYLMYKNGIKALEESQKIVRGTKGSCSIFNGAFGMIPNRTLLPKTSMVFAAEIAMTSALAFIIFGLTDSEKSVPTAAFPALIGGTVTCLACQFGNVTGCGMNPARDLGPRLITYGVGWGSQALSFGWWTYTAGPMVGAVIGGALYNSIMVKKSK